MTVSLTGGRAQLVAIKQDEQRGAVEQTFVPQELELGENASYEFGVAFANRHQNVLFGDIRGCVMVWDRNNAEVVSGLSHAEGECYCRVLCDHDTSKRFLTCGARGVSDADDVVQAVSVSRGTHVWHPVRLTRLLW